jgi:predicted phage-related endonuclease
LNISNLLWRFDSIPKQFAMSVHIHEINSREQWLALRAPNVGASEVGALFHAHPYQTYAGLLAEKRGHQFEVKDSGPMRRGRWYEGGVAKAVAELRPQWKITPCQHYYSDAKLRLGATPDFIIHEKDEHADIFGVLQTKTVERSAFAKYWTDTTPPFWVTLQVVTEMMLTGAAFGAIAAGIFDPYNPEIHIYDVPRHPDAEDRIRKAVQEFWINLESGKEPEYDYAKDGALLSVLYPAHEPGKQIDLRTDNRIGELLDRREALRDVLKLNEIDLTTVEAEIKAKLKDAESALVRGWQSVTFKKQDRQAYTVQATTFRVLRAVREQSYE